MAEIKQISLGGSVYDLTDTNAVHISGTQSIGGAKTFTGAVSLGSSATATTPAHSDNDTSVATTAMVHNLNDTQRTNCITEIPQDLVLELSGGTLKLKAGSKWYKPNGSGVFDTVDISSDRTFNFSSNTGTYVIFADMNYYGVSKMCSGATDSMLGTAYHVWYDTTNNLVKLYASNGNTPTGNTTLPIGIVTVSSGSVTSIDQAFNGFGYIGSTVFVLPGVEGLVPNGRNADGTLNNTLQTITSVNTYTNTATRNNAIIGLGSSLGRANSFVVSDDLSLAGVSTIVYSPSRNANYINSGSGATQWNWCVCCFWDATTTAITSLRPYNVFKAVDYNDTEFIAHQAMPSDKYINLTLPASGGTVTAPDDGYIYLRKTATASGEYVYLDNGSVSVDFVYTTNNTKSLILPCSKGQTVTISYTASGPTAIFRFVYANGAK